MSLALGIDIGGSGVKYCLADASGRIFARHYESLYREIAPEQLSARVSATAGRLIEEVGQRVVGLGLAMPGHVDRESLRLVDGAENLPALAVRPLPPALSEALGLPVAVENDALAATLGEARFGAGRGCDSFAMLTFGTGVGGGLMIDGRLVRGPGHQPPEFGAMVLDLEGPPNAHGQPGTLEALAGRAAFERAFAEAGLEPDVRLGFEAAAEGHAGAGRAVEAVSRRAAQAIGTITNVTGIRHCVVGGGIAGAGEPFLDAIRRALPAFTWPALACRLQILPAETGNDAGALGVVSLVFEERGEVTGS